MDIKAFQIHKRSSYVFKDIQDKYGINQDNNIYAVSDGATQGFMSQIWAEQLVKDFASNPTFDISRLIANFTHLAHQFSKQDIELSINPAIKAIQLRKKQEGASATFIGVKIENKILHYISSGDICGAIFSKNGIQFFPHTNIEDLDKDKGFLNTQKLIDNKILETQFREGKLSLYDGDNVVLMTDAIARFILKNHQFLQELIRLNDFVSFKEFIINLWETKQLEEDDITMLCIENNNQASSVKEFLAKDLEFPKPLHIGENNVHTQNINSGNDSLIKLMGDVNLLKKELYHLKQEVQHQYALIEHQKNLFQQFRDTIIAVIIGIAMGFGAYRVFQYTKNPQNQKTNIQQGGKHSPKGKAKTNNKSNNKNVSSDIKKHGDNSFKQNGNKNTIDSLKQTPSKGEEPIKKKTSPKDKTKKGSPKQNAEKQNKPSDEKHNQGNANGNKNTETNTEE
ncbi:MAG: SpoIIE family protein phosphatase [Flavobacteriaceae bacterium]|nr:SpoIIE family protein phosphatase [Flavobacteriaceae bacterium]